MQEASGHVAALVRSLCRLRASAKARGQHHLTHERRAARLVLQGMVGQRLAEDALAVLLMGIYCRDQPSTDIDAAWWLERARERLQRAMDAEQVQRGTIARAIKDQAENDIQARLSSAAMIERARAVNAELGLSLAWPEISDILGQQLRAAVNVRARRYG